MTFFFDVITFFFFLYILLFMGIKSPIRSVLCAFISPAIASSCCLVLFCVWVVFS